MKKSGEPAGTCTLLKRLNTGYFEESRLAGPVGVPLLQPGVMASSHHDDGRMPSLLELALPEGLAPLTYAFEARCSVSSATGARSRACNGILAHTGPVLRRLSLLLDYMGIYMVASGGFEPPPLCFKGK